ncbi:MAG TPA: 2-amino-4-hydroxy-6-hydroxymethyldihydropteridine diphosphokinase [Armatimonadota bacterium]|nr:2-amino-4-hydroxy-6-hydroxymethyldihydropteridine diphosphokinase [Armatimonadota bacterium]
MSRPHSPGGERVFLGLGSNLGDRDANLRSALQRVTELEGTHLECVSSFIETAPWGVEEQPSFLNAVAEIRTALKPRELLAAVKRIERELGRVPTYRWGPRLIDIDLLLYGERVVVEPELTLPHPRILERAFVWEPLREIAPEVVEELRRAALSLRGPGPDG